MQTGHLNIFVPYENKSLHHEDQLTRAFLILLRSIKLVEQLFIELLRDRMRSSGIHNAEVGGSSPPITTNISRVLSWHTGNNFFRAHGLFPTSHQQFDETC